mgnify:FL=1
MSYPHLPPADEGTEYSSRSHNGEDYITTGLFPVGSPTHTKDDLVRCPVLAMDFDAVDYLHHQLGSDSPGVRELKGILTESPREEVDDLLAEHWEELSQMLERAELTPTVVVMSGYGYHVYFWTECGGGDIPRMKLAARWLIHSVNTAAGYALADTSASDAGTRLLRPPGSFNNKGQPVEVRVTHSGGPLYRVPDDIPAVVFDRATGSSSAGPESSWDQSSPFAGINTAGPARRPNFSEVALLDNWTEQGYTTLRDLVDAELGEDGHRVRLQCPFHEGSSTDSAFLSRNDIGQPYLVCTSAQDGHTYWDGEFVPPMQQAAVVSVLQTNRDGNFRNNLFNTYHILTVDTRWQGRFWFNERSFVNMRDDRVYRDEDTFELRKWIGSHYNFEPNRQMMFDVIELICSENRRNPLVEWLDSLEWDGINRADTWMEKGIGCEESDYYRDVARKFLISCVARAYRPGCKVDTVLMLIGRQGLGKSTILRELAGPEWFDDTELNLNNKDAFMGLARAWIYEVAELASFKKSYAEKVKGFISSPVDLYRPPYKRTVQQFPRHTVIVATSNEDRPLTDPSGSRRYWPVEVTQYTNLEWLKRNRSQLWAEAVEAFRAGEQWHQTRAMEAEQRKIAEDRFTNEDPYLSVLANWLGRKGDNIFTISDACTKALGNLTVSTNRVSRLLVQCGAAPLNRRQKNGIRIREWVKPGIPLPEGRSYEDPESGSTHIDTLNKVIRLDVRVSED